MARTQPWKVSAALWERVEPLIPARPPYPKGGRPAADDRQMFAAIIYVLRTGIQWNALPRELGASSTVYDRFRQWESQGFFLRLWQAGLAEYDELASIGWDWQSVDSSTVKAPFATSRRRTRSHRLCCKKEADLLKLGKSRTKRIHYDRTEPLPRGVISKQTSFGCRVRWYLRYALSSRDLEEMMLERGLSVDHRLCCKKKANLVQLEEKRGPVMAEQHPFKWRHFHAEIIRMSRALCFKLPRSGGNDDGARIAGRPYDDLPLGSIVCSRTGETLPTPSQSHQ
jgi:transposase